MKYVLFLMVFGVFTASAQDRSSVSLSLGPSFPVGAFADQDGQNPGAGLARIGGVLDLSYQHRLGNGPFGVCAGLRARLNPINEDANLAYPKSIDTGYVYKVAKRSWETGGVFAGAFYETSLLHRWHVGLGLSAGGVDAVLPAIYATGVRRSVLVPGSQDFMVVSSKKVHAVAPSVLVRAEIRYPLTEHFSLIARAAFCYLRPTFKNVTENVVEAKGLVVPGIYLISNATVITSDIQSRNITQSMHTLDLDAGLALRL